jgi:hypothetical protein
MRLHAMAEDDRHVGHCLRVALVVPGDAPRSLGGSQLLLPLDRLGRLEASLKCSVFRFHVIDP